VTYYFNALNPAAAAVAMATPDKISERLAVDEFNDNVRLTSVNTDADHIRQRLVTHFATVKHVTVI